MRIAIDARELAGHPTGVGRFLREILREWAAMPETAEHEFVYCAPGELVLPAGSKDPAYEHLPAGSRDPAYDHDAGSHNPAYEHNAGSRDPAYEHNAGSKDPAYDHDAGSHNPAYEHNAGSKDPAYEHDRAHEHDPVCGTSQLVRRPELQFRHGRVEIEAGAGTLWEQRVLPRLARRAGADVLFCPGYSGPMFGDVPLVVAIHDVSFAAHPEWFRWREGLRRRIVTRRAARRAARVITISEFSRREIAEHLGVPMSKIDVIYPGVSHLGAASERDAPRESGQPEAPLVLYVGSIFNRRHVPETIRGFARLARRRPAVRFTIVGDDRTFPHVRLDRVIDDIGQGERIDVRAYVSDDELAGLYRSARAFVFLSEYEGFGLTPLEALASGIPIVVLDTPVAREVYGAAALYVSTPDRRAIERALEEALFDAPARARVLGAAPAVLGRYSWRQCARGVLNVLIRAGTGEQGSQDPRTAR